jgi:hypothetical protein
MSDTQDIIISTSILLKAPRDAKAMAHLRDRIAAQIRQAADTALSSESVAWSWEGTAFRYLESPDGDTNARRCFYCSKWATDRRKLDAIDGLIPGCELDGRWVCDQCIEQHDKLFGHTT